MRALSRWLNRSLARLALARSDAALLKAAGGAPRTAGGRTLDPHFQFIEAKSRARPAPAVLTPAIARAQTNALVYLFGGRRAADVNVEALRIEAEGRAIPARIYHPPVRDPTSPVLVYFHFGGGVVGNLETCDAFCAQLAEETQGPILSVDYRLAPEHPWPAGLEDARAAYRWAIENAARFDAPAGRAAVGGDSMGGNFAAIIAQETKRASEVQPVAQLLIYPAVDIACDRPSMAIFADAFPLTRAMMDWFMENYLPTGVDRRNVRVSPAHESDLSGLAPALIYGAGFDILADQGADYAARLKAAGVKTTYHCFDALAHGFTAFAGAVPAADRACRRIARETASFLRSLR
ncbi:MAG: alpha/beta hydrolase [Hyphomonadaceae bacterium]